VGGVCGAGGAGGLGVVGAGALAWLDGRARSIGLPAMVAGLVWWAPDIVGWETAAPLARSVATVLAPLYLPLLAHLVVSFPDGRLRSRPARALIGAAYAGAAVTSLALAVFRDPLDDLDCWRNCTDNVFLVDAHLGL